jgi:multiple sugar transport system ATP-binding protein
MHDGIVEQIGSPLDLYDRPDNMFVAGFIGSPAMNFIHGRIEGSGFRTSTGVHLPLTKAPAASEGRAAVYGVRPEHFRLSDHGVPVQIIVIEPTGSEMQIVAHLGEQEIVCVFRERIKARPGETIHIAPDPALVHLFDEASGARIV